ncbi:MAG: DUF3224 domain-containing protein [Gemmatimonadota bacterium]|nr:DUF3224 domain-containing protein [Gemmatimonadota bacterium]
MAHANGTFEVNLTPRPLEGPSGERGVAQMSIEKTFAGDLEGSSVGEMLAFRSAVEGSAGYVAVELVTGTLKGRTGTFVLQHSSTLHRGAQNQSIIVTPDSGTGELEGLAGELVITITDGLHFYDFDYELPAP